MVLPRGHVRRAGGSSRLGGAAAGGAVGVGGCAYCGCCGGGAYCGGGCAYCGCPYASYPTTCGCGGGWYPPGGGGAAPYQIDGVSAPFAMYWPFQMPFSYARCAIKSSSKSPFPHALA